METTTGITALLTVSEIELVYRTKVKASERPTIKRSRDAYQLFIQSWSTDKIEMLEQSKMLLLNRSNRVLAICDISSGSVSGTVVDPRFIFAAAIKANASAVIIAHNHPSSSLKPSEADISLTKKVCEGGKLLDIKILDHLIITPEAYYSFADEGFI